MDNNKSLDVEVSIVATLLRDVQTFHAEVFSLVALELTIKKMSKRVAYEGISFLTKAFPRLLRAFDSALTIGSWKPTDFTGFKPSKEGSYPMFMGELFTLIFSTDGRVSQDPSVTAIRSIRQVLSSLGKYELPYTTEEEARVLEAFKKAEKEMGSVNDQVDYYSHLVTSSTSNLRLFEPEWKFVYEAKRILTRALAACSLTDIQPRHGPGVVSTRERPWGKYTWSSISPRITAEYPIDKYFYASNGHICDEYDGTGLGSCIAEKEESAQVILVPKDSRGPRLISCEPLSHQWIQQGVSAELVQFVERSKYTKYSVFFTDQTPNRIGALVGSRTGDYVTLDLSEASDRVSLSLVKFLLPEHIFKYVSCCRTLSTTLPSGEVLVLNKFAPMGSALCFPILALVCWALASATVNGYRDVYNDNIHVYGDDIIVPTAQAANVIKTLEAVGLKVNVSKSCMSGFFRESCGMDAYKGSCVTPMRFRTPLTSFPSPNSYASWVAYANQLWDAKYFHTYENIVGRLFSIYTEIPACDDYPSGEVIALREVPEAHRPKRVRTNANLHKLERKVYVLKSKRQSRELKGWTMLLRYFAECGTPRNSAGSSMRGRCPAPDWVETMFPPSFSVREYTERNSSMLVKRWR